MAIIVAISFISVLFRERNNYIIIKLNIVPDYVKDKYDELVEEYLEKNDEHSNAQDDDNSSRENELI